MKDGDYEADALREYTDRNRGVMSQKMAEMSKLQNTLTNQAKVTMRSEQLSNKTNKRPIHPTQTQISLSICPV